MSNIPAEFKLDVVSQGDTVEVVGEDSEAVLAVGDMLVGVGHHIHNFRWVKGNSYEAVADVDMTPYNEFADKFTICIRKI